MSQCCGGLFERRGIFDKDFLTSLRMCEEVIILVREQMFGFEILEDTAARSFRKLTRRWSDICWKNVQKRLRNEF